MDKKTRANMDEVWKEALKAYFQPFVQSYASDLYDKIDWNKGYSFLEQELHIIAHRSKEKKRIMDKLVRVYPKEGGETWVLLHIEVQAQGKNDFAKRMFTYYYRILDRYNKQVASLAVLIDDQKNWRPYYYETQFWGTSLRLQYPVIKLLDYQCQKEELVKSANPVDWVMWFQLEALETRDDWTNRLSSMLRLTRYLFTRGMSLKDVILLYRFLNGVMSLPKDLELVYYEEVKELQKELNVSYMTLPERIGLEKGIVQGENRILSRQLERKFKAVPEMYLKKLQSADADTLLRWAERFVDAKTIEEIFTE